MTPTEDPVALEPAPPPTARRVPDPPRAEVNGELRDRVKKLRIGGPGDGGGRAKGSFLGRVAWLPWLLCGVLAVAWAGVAIRTYKATPANPDAGGGAVTPVQSGGGNSGGGGGSVGVGGGGGSTPAAAPGSIRLEQRGTLVVARQISVSPIDVGGRIIDLRGPTREADIAVVGGVAAVAPIQPFTEGALYKKGDIIAILDASSYDAMTKEGLASLASAEQRYEAAKQRRDAQLPASVRKVEVDQAVAQLADAKANRLRAAQKLDRVDSISSSTPDEKQLARAEADSWAAKVQNLEAALTLLKEGPRKEQMAAMEADVRSADAEVAAARARLSQAQWRLDNCTIRAPISGTVLTKTAELGKLVNPMAFSGGGAVCDLADLSDLEAELKVAERDIRKVEVGQACTIRMDAFSDRVYAGTVTRVMPIATRSDNTVGVRVKVKLFAGEIPGTFLKPEMGGVVTIRE